MKRMRSWSTCRWRSYTASTHGQTSGGNWTECAAEKGAGPNPGDRRGIAGTVIMHCGYLTHTAGPPGDRHAWPAAQVPMLPQRQQSSALRQQIRR